MATEIFEAQIQALLDLGVDRFDAEMTARWVDERRYRVNDIEKDSLPAEVLEVMSEVSPVDLVDAMADWMASPAVPNRYKRLLHARSASELS